MSEAFLILSTKRGPFGNSCVWYRPKAMGYTQYIEEAGYFEEEEAKRLCGDMDYLFAIPLSEVEKRSKTVVPFNGPNTFKEAQS